MKYPALFCAVLALLACNLSAVEIIKCPERAPNGFVVLKSNQDECVKLKVAVAKQSQTISDTIADFGGDASTVIPMASMDNSQLRDIATIMDQAFEKSDQVIKTKLISMTKNKPYKLILIIKDANFLAVERVLNAGLDVFAKKIFEEDLPKLGELDSRLYATYKENGLQNWPPELARAVVQRNWYLLPPTLIATLKHKGEVEAVAFSHDGKYIATGSDDSTAKLWDANVRGNNTKPLTILKHANAVFGLAFSPDDKLILTASKDSTARLWNGTARGEDANPLATFQHGGWVVAAEFSPDGSTFVSGSMDGKARLWDASARGNNDRPLATLKDSNAVRVVAFAADEKKFWTIGSEPKKITLKQWDVNARGNDVRPVETLDRTVADEEIGLAFSPDGKSFLTRGMGERDASLWGTAAKDSNTKPLATLNNKHFVSAGAYSKDSKFFSTADDGTLKLWDATVRGDNARPLTTWKHGGIVRAVGFSTDGKYILTGGSDAKAKLWDLRYAANHLSLTATQIVIYARQNNLTADKLPKHLLNELDDTAKTYLLGK